MKLFGSFIFLLFLAFLLSAGDPLRQSSSSTESSSPSVDHKVPAYTLRSTKEENHFHVGRHLIIETEDNREVHLKIKVRFAINRTTREVRVRFETDNEGDKLDSIERIYCWD